MRVSILSGILLVLLISLFVFTNIIVYANSFGCMLNAVILTVTMSTEVKLPFDDQSTETTLDIKVVLICSYQCSLFMLTALAANIYNHVIKGHWQQKKVPFTSKCLT